VDQLWRSDPEPTYAHRPDQPHHRAICSEFPRQQELCSSVDPRLPFGLR